MHPLAHGPLVPALKLATSNLSPTPTQLLPSYEFPSNSGWSPQLRIRNLIMLAKSFGLVREPSRRRWAFVWTSLRAASCPLPTLLEVKCGASRELRLPGQAHRLLGLIRAAEKPTRPGSSLEPEGRAHTSLEESEACGLLTAFVQVLDVHVLWGQVGGCRVRLLTGVPALGVSGPG